MERTRNSHFTRIPSSLQIAGKKGLWYFRHFKGIAGLVVRNLEAQSLVGVIKAIQCSAIF